MSWKSLGSLSRKLLTYRYYPQTYYKYLTKDQINLIEQNENIKCN